MGHIVEDKGSAPRCSRTVKLNGARVRLSAGLGTPQALDRLLSDALRRKEAADALLSIADRVAAAGIDHMSMDVINAEVKAARAERRQRAGRSLTPMC